MLICGVKLTHDAAVAVIDAHSERLLFSVEVEKRSNNARYSSMGDTRTIGTILRNEGVDPGDIDRWVIDGWRGGKLPNGMGVAHYHEYEGLARGDAWGGPLALERVMTPLQVDNINAVSAASTRHLAGHIIGSYAASPFSAAEQPANVLVWDGGCDPRLYHVDPRVPNAAQRVRFIGRLGLGFYGFMYGVMGKYFGPFAEADFHQRPLDTLSREELLGGREAPGKLMSWIAHGRPQQDLVAMMTLIHHEIMSTRDNHKLLDMNQDGIIEHTFMRELRRRLIGENVADADVLASIHKFIERALVRGTSQLVVGQEERCINLVFTGGCALNIKWNSALRAAGFNIWVPPFCNDTGGALGAAASFCALNIGLWHFDWSVFSGPQLGYSAGEEHPAYRRYPIALRQVAERLVQFPERPIVFMHGRAEIGPRALGHRSIIAAPQSASMRDKLNELKRRESWRPVAPLCLEAQASHYFSPGNRDPHMLFDHEVISGVRDKLGAVTHLDGTARLQTVSGGGDAVMEALLHHYQALTGLPVLCNTSANHLGRGFFPDAGSALVWAEGKGVDVYADGTFYEGIK